MHQPREKSTASKAGVVLLPTGKHLAEHEQKVHELLAKKMADVLSIPFLGTYGAVDIGYDKAVRGAANFYFVPDDTLVNSEKVRSLGIVSVTDFFGGFTTEAFMATKAISHPLFKMDSQAPLGWSWAFAQKLGDTVLQGYTAFTLTDTLRAGIKLLDKGPLRIKTVRACGGRGQFVVTNRDELASLVATLDEQEVATWGLVLEENLRQVTTFSVGQVILGGITTSYVGRQHLTRDNDGETVYGGSSLTLVRGNYLELLHLALTDKEYQAVTQARAYEAAAFVSFPGLLASRRNYDVAFGIDAAGNFCSGVLEQSWRIGGASAAEIFAIEAFARDKELSVIRASTQESYGTTEPPENAVILYRAEDPEVGLITKTVRVEPYADAD